MDLIKFKSVLSAGAAAFIAAVSVPFAANAVAQQEMGNINGLKWLMWNQNQAGDVFMEVNDDGFECAWKDIENFLASIGYNYSARPKQYKKLASNIKVEYELEYTPKGNSFYGIHGYTQNPITEYYIIEGWGSWRPPGYDCDRKGTFTSDGNAYDVYKAMRYNQPCIEGTTTFPIYYSVRNESTSIDNTPNHIYGQINVTNHFNAWEKYGLDMSGTIYNVEFCVEGYRSDGEANLKKLRITPYPTASAPLKPDENGYYFKTDFETPIPSDFDIRGKGYMTLATYRDYQNSNKRGFSMEVGGRSETWHGVTYTLPQNTFNPNTSYSVGAAVLQEAVDTAEFRLLFRYNDKAGNTHFDVVASSEGKREKWTDLSNTSYKFPEYFTAPAFCFEMSGSTDYFYVDDFYIGIDGTRPLAYDLADSGNMIQGDINNDGKVDVFDMVAMKKLIINMLEDNSQPPENADLNGDNDVNVADLLLLQKYLLGNENVFATPDTTTTTTTITTASVTETTAASTSESTSVDLSVIMTTANITATNETTATTAVTTTESEKVTSDITE